MAKTLLGYKDVMSLGINKVMAYRMIHMVQESEEYKSSNVSKVICGAKQVPISMFTNVFPEFKKHVRRCGGKPIYIGAVLEDGRKLYEKR